jgi:heavy metal sensor kinase
MMNTLYRRSIRFRLTAWYAGVLTLAILLFALAINAVMERRLDDNFDQNLLQTARAIQRTATVQLRPDTGRYYVQMPALNPFSIAGYFIQIYDLFGESDYRSDSLGQRDLPTPDLSDTQNQITFETISIDDQQMRIIYAPLRLSSREDPFAVLVVATSTEPFQDTLDELRTAVVVGSIIAIAVAVAGGWFLAGRALRPVERMRREAAEIALEGTGGAALAERIQDPGTDDEISRLARTFNELLGRLEAAFETERRFIADASHELRTPLTAIRGNVDVLLRQARRSETGSPEQQEALEDIQRETSRMSRLLEDLLTLARASAEAPDHANLPGPATLATPIAQAVRTAQALAPDRVIEVSISDDPAVRANPDQIEQVVLILLDNALRHSRAPAPVRVTLRRNGTMVELQVTDEGEGIEPEHLAHLFDRFYRVDTARSRASGGTGLGLAIARAIIQRAGGTITVASEPGAGSTFTIALPLITEASSVR